MKNEKEITERLVKLSNERRIEQKRILHDSKYGKFIIQTNEVQLFLYLLILSRLSSSFVTKKLINDLEKVTFGNLISHFRICINIDESSFLNDLDLYNGKRNALAHKMYTKKKLTEKDCESSIKLGEKLLAKLNELIKQRYEKNV